jgi:subtilisin family serine protease
VLTIHARRRRTAAILLTMALAMVVTVAPALLPGAARPGAPGAAAADDIRDRQRWVLQALNLERAWAVTKGGGVTVAVIDSAVDPDVAALRGRVRVGPHMGSVAFERGAPEPGVHGTAMAALVAGSGTGGGYVGAAPEARILSLPMELDRPIEGDAVPPEPDARSGRDSPLARAIRYAADHGAKVISMSFGAFAVGRAEREAVSYALARGVVLVASVGNQGGTSTAEESGTSFWAFPAGYPGVIGVAAVDQDGRPAPFSSDNLSVLVAAPGVRVPVVQPGGAYAEADGTSPASALVAGVVALIKAEYPRLSPELVAQALAAGTRHRPAVGYDDRVGFGVVDAAAALERAGRLAGHRRTVEVPDDRHFGPGPTAAGPARPGPDPVKVWVYGLGVVLGVVAFVGAVAVLVRRVGPR